MCHCCCPPIPSDFDVDEVVIIIVIIIVIVVVIIIIIIIIIVIIVVGFVFFFFLFLLLSFYNYLIFNWREKRLILWEELCKLNRIGHPSKHTHTFHCVSVCGMSIKYIVLLSSCWFLIWLICWVGVASIPLKENPRTSTLLGGHHVLFPFTLTWYHWIDLKTVSISQLYRFSSFFFFLLLLVWCVNSIFSYLYNLYRNKRMEGSKRNKLELYVELK